jgi:hypothetical protein
MIEDPGKNPKRRTTRRLPGIPNHVEQFGICILFHLMLPFLPLGIEATVLHRVDRKTQFLFLALYPLGIGVSSRSRLMFAFTVVVSLVYSIFFGLISGNVVVGANAYTFGYVCLAFLILIHTGERYNRHVVDGDAFWEFR